VLPKETACYDCYQHRQQSNLANPERYQALRQALAQQKLPLLDIQITPCVSLLCYEILRLLSDEVPPLTLGAVMEFNLTTAELVRHPLLKVPRCPTCRRDIRPFPPTRFWSEISLPDTATPAANVEQEQQMLHPMD
jgi:bacteriocin biosynthesis cyclodehydratase domain-containing protein